MRVERVHAAVPDQPDQMKRPVAALHGTAQLDQGRESSELAARDRLRDAHHVLGDDAAGAEVQVPDLAVADLTLGEAYRGTRCMEQRARRVRPQALPRGRIGELDGVAFAAGAEAPAVEHEEDDRGALPTPLCHIEGDAI